ncbi:class I SAM-dependent methyltransferase [Nodosilinea nodulosa]|uniref:class I SAM-dependent methyltransferase n=1 Tax=Nodosilinea nodulosa TaxID=416001 RepID=UPI0003025D8D|nr:class I SAM-dependent methyltransferase [Nodosilinea nodulosa]
MDYSDLKQAIGNYSIRDLEQRKNWYTPAAAAYNEVRPRYPQELIRRVVDLTQLPSNAKILEVGCGPATATVAFAQLGYRMICLEPNPDFCRLARQNCRSYSNVDIQNTSFEEWMLEAGEFDAVLAASSFHWISPEVGYPKAAKALRERGHLILLWNKELQPAYEVYRRLSEVYQIHAPSLDRYEDRETQEKILQGLGQIVEDSGQFKQVVSASVASEVTYTTDQYLALLNTYSPYLKLERQNKDALFEGLRDKIEAEFDGYLRLFYLSAFHIAQKRQMAA